MKRRSTTEITIQILEAANGYGNHDKGATLTNLMYDVSISNNHQLKEYLVSLVEEDFVSYDSTTTTFKTTEKGLMVLQGYNQINKILKQQQI